MPCHSNQQRHGKGVGLKSHDVFTVPGCLACHRELDFGKNLSREEKQNAFQLAHEQWLVDLFQTERVKVA